MPAYTFNSAGAWVGAGTADVTASMPTSWSVGNLGLLYACARAASETITDPPGWYRLGASSSGHVALFGRILQSGDTAPTVTFSGTSNHRLNMCAFGGDVYTDLTSIVAHSQAHTNAGSTGFPYTGLTVSTDNCLVIACGSKTKTATADGSSVDAEAGFTRIGTVTGSGTSLIAVWDYVQQTTQSSIGADGWTLTGTTEGQTVGGFFVALKSGSVAPIVAYYQSLMQD